MKQTMIVKVRGFETTIQILTKLPICQVNISYPSIIPSKMKCLWGKVINKIINRLFFMFNEQ